MDTSGLTNVQNMLLTTAFFAKSRTFAATMLRNKSLVCHQPYGSNDPTNSVKAPKEGPKYQASIPPDPPHRVTIIQHIFSMTIQRYLCKKTHGFWTTISARVMRLRVIW